MTVLVFDTETQGLPDWKLPADHPTQPRMVSLAALLAEDDGTEVEHFHHIVRPDGWTVPEDVVRIHGITTERCAAEGIPVADVLGKFNAFVDRSALLVAYGIRFDQKIIRGEMRRAGLPDRYGERPTFDLMWQATKLCKLAPTYAMHAAGRHHNKTAKLSEAAELLLGLKHEGAHDALNDVRMSLMLYQFMHRKGLRGAA